MKTSARRPLRPRVTRAVAALLFAAVAAGFIGVGPASAHVSTPSHLWTKHLKTMAAKVFYTKKQAYARYYTKKQANGRFVKKTALSVAGTINRSGNPVQWTKLKGVPGSLADGVDANSGGDITAASTSAKSGLKGGGVNGSLALALKDCADGQLLQFSTGPLGWQCATPALGDITSVVAGAGLSGGGTSGAAALAVDFGGGADQVSTGALARGYCALAAAFPASYPAAQCASRALTLASSAANIGLYTAIAIGADGYPIVSFQDLTNRDLYTVHCTARDCSSAGAPQMLVNGGSPGDGGDGDIAIGDDGLPVVSYVAGGDLRLIHCTQADCGAADAAVTLDSAGASIAYTSVAIDGDGHPLVAYRENSAAALKVVHCTSADCTAKDAPRTLDSLDGVGLYASMAIGADGYPVIAYGSVFPAGLHVIHCTSADCLTSDGARLVVGAGEAPADSAIAIGTDGYPVVSYHNAFDGSLRLLHCTSDDCATRDTPRVLDSNGDSSEYSSIAIGTDGYPVVSHRAADTNRLETVHCTKPDCSTFDSPLTIEGAGNYGYYSSMAIGMDGYPVVSFWDSAAGVLKFVQVR